MKTIGMIGGMSWESTVPYYRILNEAIKARLGGLHSARLILYSFDFAEIEVLQRQGDWDTAAQQLAVAAVALERAGAELLVLCSNTMHKVAPSLAAAVRIPLLHIVDCTGAAVAAVGHRTVGLLGTRFTMEEPFYRERLEQRHGLHVLVPASAERERVHRVILDELCLGRFDPDSRADFRDIIAGLVAQGAQAVILGCTEISLLVGPGDASVPLFDTTRLHAEAAAATALA